MRPPFMSPLIWSVLSAAGENAPVPVIGLRTCVAVC